MYTELARNIAAVKKGPVPISHTHILSKLQRHTAAALLPAMCSQENLYTRMQRDLIAQTLAQQSDLIYGNITSSTNAHDERG